MTIPGLKVLDELIAGIPLNSTQRLEIGKLKEQVAALQKENEELKTENATLKGAKIAPSLKRVGDAYFETGPDGNAVGYPHCLKCWESSGKRSSLVLTLGTVYRCTACKIPVHRGLGWPPQSVF